MEIAFQKDAGPKKENKFWKFFSFLKDPSSIFYYYLLLVVLGFIYFSSTIFSNYFTTAFTGDYVAQQIPFYTNGYDDWWTFLKTGQFVFYDTNTYLGANNIGSNSFYYVFDPFFTPILFWPRQSIAQGMVVLSVFKIATAGLFFYFYMREMGASDMASKISGVAYAFCGWMAWNLWFNCYTEVVTAFPIMLWGVEKVLRNKTPWLLAFGVFLMAMVNFFFCITMSICTFLYAMFRYFQRVKEHDRKDNLEYLGLGFLGFTTGLLLSCAILLPTCLIALNTTRSSNVYLSEIIDGIKANDWGTVFNHIFNWGTVDYYYNNKYRSLYIFLDFIFPAFSDRGTPLVMVNYETYEPEAGSLFAFIPIMIFFFPALMYSIKNKRISPLVGTLLMILMLVIPFTYFMFHGFTQPYSRWTLFATSSLIAFVGCYLDKVKEEPKMNLIHGSVFLLFLVLIGCLIGVILIKTDVKEGFTFNERAPIWAVGLIEAAYIIIVTLIIFLVLKFKKEHLEKVLLGIVCVETAITGAIVIQGQGVSDYKYVNNGINNNNMLHAMVEQLKKEDPTYYRCYSSLENDAAQNDSMRNDYNGLGFFHSLYNFNIDNFLYWNDVKYYGSWASSYVEKRANLDIFLGVKYYFVLDNTLKYRGQAGVSSNYSFNVPYGFIDITDRFMNLQSKDNMFYRVYENTNFIDLGFTYDTYSIATAVENNPGRYSYDRLDETSAEEHFLKEAVIYDKDEEYILSMNPNFVKEDDIRRDSKGLQCVKTYYDIGHRTDGGVTYAPNAPLTDLLNLYPSEDPTYPFKYQNTSPGKGNESGRWVCVITPTTGQEYFEYDPDGIAYYVSCFSSFYTDYHIDILLVDDKNELIDYDNHNDDSFGSLTGNYRGMYTRTSYSNGVSKHDAPKVSKIIIVQKRVNLYTPSIYYEPYTQYQKRLDSLKEYPLTDVHYSTNHFDFKTNFDERRLVVTQLAYEDGWSVTATHKDGSKEKLKVFVGQGGFVSFVSGVGECSYTLDFYPPYLQLGTALSAVGLFLFFSTMIGYYYIDTNYCMKYFANDEFITRDAKKPAKFRNLREYL